LRWRTSCECPSLGVSRRGNRRGVAEGRGRAGQTGEPVVRLETDKVDVEVSAEHDGVLAKILRQQGEDVRVGEALGIIEVAEAGAARKERPPAQEPKPEITLPAEGTRGDGEGDRVPAGKATAKAGREAPQAGGPPPAVETSAAPASDEGRSAR